MVRLTSTPKPDYPHDLASARVWLEWALASAHQASCYCHNCVQARAFIAEDLRQASNAGDDAAS